MTSPAAPGQIVTFQGVAVPAESINPALFAALTRRRRNPEKAFTYAGLGLTDDMPLRRSDLLAKIRLRFTGTLVIAGTTVTPTYNWPHNLAKRIRFEASGQTNLFNVSGLGTKALEFTSGVITDRGVPNTVGATSTQNGTLSHSSETWGVPPNVAAAAGTYPVELEWTIPIVEDDRDLAGIIFAQSEDQDLVLHVDWAQASDLFTGLVAGTDTATLTGKLIVEPTRYSIPVQGNKLVLPDLSMFHQVVESRQPNTVAVGENEVMLVGAGIGRSLQRVLFRTVTGTPPVPLAMNDTSYGTIGWRYGSNTDPETWYGGTSLRQWGEEVAGTDVGAVFGYGLLDFNRVNAFRDSIDEGTTSQLRIFATIQNGVVLNSPVIEYIQETMLRA